MTDPTRLHESVQSALIEHFKIVARLSPRIKEDLRTDYKPLHDAISTIIHFGGNDYSRVSFSLEDGWDDWAALSYSGGFLHPRTVHMNLRHGFLLVDGRPMGTLEAVHRNHYLLTLIFGEQRIRTFGSNLPGMTYQIENRVDNHILHIGFAGEKLFVRAVFGNQILQIIPRGIFGFNDDFDLPSPLVQDCLHFFNVRTGILEVRKQKDMWKIKPGNWTVDFRARTAFRNSASLEDPKCRLLVDPRSRLFGDIRSIFSGFESPFKLLVYQAKTKIHIDLKQMDLQFHTAAIRPVRGGSADIICGTLNAKLHRYQDCGTWHGLKSMLVLEHKGFQKTSVLIPMGKASWKRNGHYVDVLLDSSLGEYGMFTVNRTLGRLDCAVEPRLLYLKAELHALTSFVLEDSLTGRTGAEEALCCLQTAAYEPWRPLHLGAVAPLQTLFNLIPTRQFYPLGLKLNQKIQWDPHLPVVAQREEYRSLVLRIFQKSEELRKFQPESSALPKLASKSDGHLDMRAEFRRRHFQRDLNARHDVQPFDTYKSRHFSLNEQKRKNVLEVGEFINSPPALLPSVADLSELFPSWPRIGGYGHAVESPLLSQRLQANIAEKWGSLVEFCRANGRNQRFRVMFLLGLVCYQPDVNMEAVRTILCFGLRDDLLQLSLPEWPLYENFTLNAEMTASALKDLILKNCSPTLSDEVNSLTADRITLSFKERRRLEEIDAITQSRFEKQAEAFARYLMQQWPCLEPSLDELGPEVSFNTKTAMVIIKPEWLRLYKNTFLTKHVIDVQKVLHANRVEVDYQAPVVRTKPKVYPLRSQDLVVPSLSDLVLKGIPHATLTEIKLLRGFVPLEARLKSENIPPQRQNIPPQKSPVENIAHRPRNDLPVSTPQEAELGRIIDGFKMSPSPIRQTYATELSASLDALKMRKPDIEQESGLDNRDLSIGIESARAEVNSCFRELQEALEQFPRSKWLKMSGLSPVISKVDLLQQLRELSRRSLLSVEAKEALVTLGLLITNLQRLLRIHEARAKLQGTTERSELRNPGHTNWDPMQNPGWLLLEIDSNIMIRPEQVDVALATINPKTGRNACTQLVMGAGKTSCILPMAAIILADRKSLLRIIVPRPLMLQTAQTLQSRLGGLLDRVVKHVPFSRRTPSSEEIIQAFGHLHADVLRGGGIMICLPEHILSWKLGGAQKLCDSRLEEASQMVEIQRWLDEKCRDVLDECDEILAVRMQLIYPSGTERNIDGHPHRWETVQSVLGIVRMHLYGLQQRHPLSMEVVERHIAGDCSNKFPLIYLMRERRRGRASQPELVNGVCEGELQILPEMENTQKAMVRRYLTEQKPHDAVVDAIDSMFSEKPSVKHKLYLLRGLLVHRILLMTLRKRWNVQYGLHQSREPLAVPYLAKGVPSEQAEWGHPEVGIILTCLSFYYTGLSLPQMRDGLQRILQSEDAPSDYQRWLGTVHDIPEPLRDWNIINVDDDQQLRELWSYARFDMGIINHYMNHFVFPKYAKTFKTKLQTSGWDLPVIEGPSGQQSESCRTTGFSGTNDNRHMLPLNISQQDLTSLLHTNAQVLTYLLEDRNRGYCMIADHNGKRLAERDFPAFPPEEEGHQNSDRLRSASPGDGQQFPCKTLAHERGSRRRSGHLLQPGRTGDGDPPDQ